MTKRPHQSREWVKFVFLTDTGKWRKNHKTGIWEVVTTYGAGQILGAVKWYGPWRGYAFFPESGTLYEQKCLHQIADFCEQRTTDHKASLKVRKALCNKAGEVSDTASTGKPLVPSCTKVP